VDAPGHTRARRALAAASVHTPDDPTILVALAVNLLVATQAMAPASRVRVPYSPCFLDQVSAGRVSSITSITSKGTAVQETFSVAQSSRWSCRSFASASVLANAGTSVPRAGAPVARHSLAKGARARRGGAVQDDETPRDAGGFRHALERT
jgi:hypothetical protein